MKALLFAVFRKLQGITGLAGNSRVVLLSAVLALHQLVEHRAKLRTDIRTV